MEVIFNKILSGTWILYYSDTWNGKYSPYIHIYDFWDFWNHFFLFGCELNLDGFCPVFVFLSGIKKVDVYKKVENIQQNIELLEWRMKNELNGLKVHILKNTNLT